MLYRHHLLHRLASLVAVAAVAMTGTLAWGPSAEADPPQYQVTILETFPGDSIAIATGINNEQQICGYSRAPGESYVAWVWADGQLTDLGNFGGNSIQTRRINELGSVVGQGGDEDQVWHTLIWIDGEYIDLPTFGGPGAVAMGINIHNHVVGHAQTALPDGFWQAYVWDGQTMTNLGTLGGNNSAAYEINDDGIIAGMAANAAIEGRAVFWEDGIIHELEHPAEHPSSVAYAINNAGTMVGAVGTGYEDLALPVMWIDGELSYLQPYPLAQNANPFAVNEDGVVVGWSRVAWNDVDALLWHEGQVYALDDLVVGGAGIEFVYAWDVNDHGRIVGMCRYEDLSRAYLLTPIVPGDINGDGVVDVLDLLELIAAWGPCPDPPDPCDADLDEDGEVTVLDLLLLLSFWS